RRIRANESPRADLCPVLSETIIIAGDRSRANVGLCPDMGVANVGQVVDLRALVESGVLDLTEIADLGGRGNARAGTQAREWANLGIGLHNGTLKVGEGTDARTGSDFDARTEEHVRLQ